ncbi:MAG: alpha/beta hydrolase [Elusimicrobia bacterium]|nr:alpha/beta hydrolase [Elusimicrobiota bacterium]
MTLWWLLAIPGAWLFLRWFERANLYFPSRTLEADPGMLGLAFEDLRLAAADGTSVHAWFVPLEERSPVVLFCHGNAGNISHRLDKLLALRRAGAAALFFDYRGYGRSSGRPDEQGTYLDAEAAYLWLSEVKRVPPERLFILGESLGGAVAMELALRRRAGGLILESTFTSVVEMCRRVFPFLPARLIVRFRYDTLSKIGRLAAPLLVMHSPEDEIVPFAMGRRLYEAAPGPKTFMELRGGHNDGFMDSGPVYERALAEFISRPA